MQEHMLRGLSLKIFIWFWLTMIMSGIASIVVALFFPSHTIVVQAKQYFEHKLTRSGQIAIRIYEQNGRKALDTFIEQIESISSFRIYLLNAQNVPLQTVTLPAGAQDLASRAMASAAIEITGWTNQPLIAKKITSDNGHDYIVMLAMPMGLVQYFFQKSYAHLFRFLASFIAAALVCLLLARYLTAPIRKLQSAVRRFAQGDLSVRVGAKIGNRKDEIATLGQDFDAMAAKIETLMSAHERLLRDIAHELRSPLTRLNVALEITRKHTGAETKRFLDRITQETDNLNRLITQLLTLSRLENADTPPPLHPIALERMIEAIAKDASFEGQAKGCAVDFTCENRCVVQADGNLLRSAIENVTRNALRFTPAGTHVKIVQKIKPYKTNSFVVIQVRDFGPGVPQDALAQLFQPFFRAVHTQARSSGGAGLGLAIAYRAIQLHKGQITAANVPDGGLIVEICLPLT